MTDTTTFIKFTKTGDLDHCEGKNSTVFLAMDEQLGDELVIKKIEKSKFYPEEYFSESKKLYASKHPNIMEIQYASQDDEYIYLAMPYYSNGSLNSLLGKRFLSIREIIKYSLDLLNAVSFIHSKNLLHLDIKPANILLDVNGKAVLTDFGLSRYMDENGIADQQIAYELHADPEFLQNSARTVQSDIYQIGLTMYRFCNGIDVLEHQIVSQKITNRAEFGIMILKGKFPNRKHFLPHIPRSMKKIVLKALNVDPSERYKNTIEMMNDISKIHCNYDWIYTGNDNQPYYKILDNYRIHIEVNNINGQIMCIKTNLSTEKSCKMNRYCIKTNNRKGEIAKQLFEIMRSIE